MIPKGATGRARTIMFTVIDGTGRVADFDFASHDVGSGFTDYAKVWPPTESGWVNMKIANITALGTGDYLYELDDGQDAVEGKVMARAFLPGDDVDNRLFYDDIVDLTPITADSIVTALDAAEHFSGYSWLGLKKRIEALISGEASGLKGAHVQFLINGSVVFETDQNVAAGSRVQADTSGSE